jgi:4-hydroxybutyrate dehydrogenase/sulfolactaldehyde 3-reductase
VENIGFVGLGTMGGAMAANLVRAGHRVRGHDVDATAMARFAAGGGEPSASARAAAEGADVVITMLPDGPDVERAVLGSGGAIEGLRSGAVLVDMSTIDPSVTRRVGAALAARGVDMVDSPVGKTADHAVAGTLTLMVGGDDAVVERVRPILMRMGSDFFRCGGLGMGEAMKLTNNFLAQSILAADAEALVLGRKAGLSLEVMLSVLRTTMAWNNQLGVAMHRKALAGDFAPGFMVRLAEKDQRLALAMAGDLGVPTPVGAAAYATLDEAARTGLAGADVGAVLRLRETQTGVEVRLPAPNP